METASAKQKLVATSPDVIDGAPVFAGTTVPVQTLIDYLEVGDSIDGFVKDYPAVSRDVAIALLREATALVVDASVGPLDVAQTASANGSHSASLSNDNHVAETTTKSGDDGPAPYVNWESRELPDPRTAPLGELVKGLVEIVGAEGPILCYRAYTLYARSIGLQKIREETKLRFNRAMIRAVETGVLLVNDEAERGDLTAKIARLPGSAEIVLRTRGDRKIEEVPPLEIAAYMRTFTTDLESLDEEGAAWLFRSVLDGYELIRMTDHTKAVLQLSLTLAQDSAPWA